MSPRGHLLVPFHTPEDAERLTELVAGQSLEQYPDQVRRGIYREDLEFRPEQNGQNRILDYAQLVQRGYGDCEDLAAARLAELWQAGYDARAYCLTDNGRLWHMVIIYPDGTIEDPSRALHPIGIKAQAYTYQPSPGVFALDYEQDAVPKTLFVEPDLDIGGYWDYASRALSALVPAGSTVLRSAFPDVANIAQAIASNPKVQAAGKGVISKIARKYARKRKQPTPTLCKLAVFDRRKGPIQISNFAHCMQLQRDHRKQEQRDRIKKLMAKRAV